jgi:hypothetical protein
VSKALHFKHEVPMAAQARAEQWMVVLRAARQMEAELAKTWIGDRSLLQLSKL